MKGLIEVGLLTILLTFIKSETPTHRKLVSIVCLPEITDALSVNSLGGSSIQTPNVEAFHEKIFLWYSSMKIPFPPKCLFFFSCSEG